MAQLVEWSLPVPEVRGLNPVIGNIYYLFSINCIEKTKINKKETGNGPFFLKKNIVEFSLSFSRSEEEDLLTFRIEFA